jgi:hypothetical protein
MGYVSSICLMGRASLCHRNGSYNGASDCAPVPDTQIFSPVNQLTNYFVQPLTYGRKCWTRFATYSRPQENVSILGTKRSEFGSEVLRR